MTGIPANVQNCPGGNQTERPKVQAQTADAKEDFGKVLDRQKSETVKDSPETEEVKKDVTDTGDVKAPESPKETQTEDGKAADGPEGEAMETEKEPEQPAAAENWIMPDVLLSEQPAEELLPEELEEVMEVLQSAIQQIRELLMQQLNLTPEELELLMQDQGLADADLLQPETVNQLILNAAGEENPLAMVMDENLYARQQIISREHQEITHVLEEQLGEQEKDLPRVLESLQKSVSSQPVQETAVMAENHRDGSGRETEESADSRQQNHDDAGQILFQNYTTRTQAQTIGQTGTAATVLETVYLDTQDSQQIMDQILDYMKVSMKSEDTVLDMQLHPESLGTLHVQISAREGVMTAHFTASSEAVKTVLENQMTALKESFQQQDIRVDAIEVTVESHQFESNLEQGRQRESETDDRRPKRRRLDLSSLEPGEELTETEQILTDMMVANGNSVDYLA